MHFLRNLRTATAEIATRGTGDFNTKPYTLWSLRTVIETKMFQMERKRNENKQKRTEIGLKCEQKQIESRT